MIFESHRCSCNNNAEKVESIYRRVTAYSGIYYFCRICGPLEPDFGADDPSYYFWEIKDNTTWRNLVVGEEIKNKFKEPIVDNSDDWKNANERFNEVYMEHVKRRAKEDELNIETVCKWVYQQLLKEISDGRSEIIINDSKIKNLMNSNLYVKNQIIDWANKNNIKVHGNGEGNPIFTWKISKEVHNEF